MSDLPADKKSLKNKIYLQKNGNNLDYILKKTNGEIVEGSILSEPHLPPLPVGALTREHLSLDGPYFLDYLRRKGKIDNVDSEPTGLGYALRTMIASLQPQQNNIGEDALIARSIAAATADFRQQYGQVPITKDNILQLMTCLDRELNQRLNREDINCAEALLNTLANGEVEQNLDGGTRLVIFFESFGFFD